MIGLYVQVNGKTYGSIMVSSDARHSEISAIARSQPHVARLLRNEKIQKVVVTDKMINFIVEKETNNE